ncbi:MAG: hypothetical protein Q8L14_33310 [Myxococcales bacterium]|nr:hypothetical protein [Myxococcales bacterium]
MRLFWFAALLTFAAPARAQDDRLFRGTTLLGGTYYQGGFAYGSGGLIHRPGHAPVSLTGLRFQERHGVVSYGITAILGAMAIVSSAVESNSTREVFETKEYVNGREQVTSRTTVTTTTYTVVKTQEQVNEELRQLEEGLSGGTWLDLTVYSAAHLGLQRGSPGGGGFDASLGLDAVLGYLGSDPIVLDVGVQFASISSPAPAGLDTKELTYASVGAIGRLYVPVTRFFTVTAEFILNFLSLEYLLDGFAALEAQGRNVTSPIKLGVQTALTDYVYLRAQGTLGGLGFTDGKLGFQLEAGVRL